MPFQQMDHPQMDPMLPRVPGQQQQQSAKRKLDDTGVTTDKRRRTTQEDDEEDDEEYLLSRLDALRAAKGAAGETRQPQAPTPRQNKNPSTVSPQEIHQASVMNLGEEEEDAEEESAPQAFSARKMKAAAKAPQTNDGDSDSEHDRLLAEALLPRKRVAASRPTSYAAAARGAKTGNSPTPTAKGKANESVGVAIDNRIALENECRNCRLPGHRWRNCKDPCKNCGKPGHSRHMCKEKKKD